LVLTNTMEISLIAPKIRSCRTTMRVRPNGLLLSRLRIAPIGFWLSSNLADVEGGSTPTAKQRAVYQAGRQFFGSVEVKIQGDRLLIRRVPCQPNSLNPRQVFYRVPQCGTAS
jgi:hypothetical protein